MAIVGLEGSYIFGMKLIAVDESKIADVKRDQKQAIANDVASKILGITLSDIARYAVNNSSAMDAVSGLLDFYPAATLSQLQNYMTNASFSSVMQSCTRALSSIARINNPCEVQPTTEVDFGFKESDFIEFIVQESIGFVLPMYQLRFLLHDKSVLKSLNRSSRISFTFGTTLQDSVTMPATIFNVMPIDQGEDTVLVTMSGYLEAPNWLTVEHQNSFTGTSYELLSSTLPKYGLKLYSNIQQTNDAMTWQSDCVRPVDYFMKVWQHSFIDQTSQLCTAIDCEGNFRFTELSKARELAKSKVLDVPSRLQFKENPFYANFGSLRKQRYVYDIETNTMSMLNLTDTTGAVTPTKIDKKLTGIRTGKYSILSPEVHKNWYLAELLNQSKLLSTVTQTAFMYSFNALRSVYPTDIIMLNSPDTKESGQYLVCGRIIHIKNRQTSVYLEVARESFAPITGTKAV